MVCLVEPDSPFGCTLLRDYHQFLWPRKVRPSSALSSVILDHRRRMQQIGLRDVESLGFTTISLRYGGPWMGFSEHHYLPNGKGSSNVKIAVSCALRFLMMSSRMSTAKDFR